MLDDVADLMDGNMPSDTAIAARDSKKKLRFSQASPCVKIIFQLLPNFISHTHVIHQSSLHFHISTVRSPSGVL